eukprot:TRINITY_DN8866_c0_g1_i1.p1 TRINITY_DN8866_c0_g1~~TRINITY_DN8866_c0_g1_i1.p1  ORF type:complete len:555 (+),score=76.72 TRINITY_DN8866_c0_g1_i1:156-1667(+)
MTVWDLGLAQLVQLIYKKIKTSAFEFGKSLPFVREKVQLEVEKQLRGIESSMLGSAEERAKYNKFVVLPPKGLSEEDIMNELTQYQKMAKHVAESGKVSGAVYNGDNNLTRIVNEAMYKFAWANPLHTSLFPGVRKMEAEVVAMTTKLFNGDANTCGTMTSGGTESILMAIRAHKEWAKQYKNITQPHMVVPVTAHAAFDKAADYFGIRISHVPIDPDTCKVDIPKLKKVICRNTILIVGSCPGFPHGVADDIEALSDVAIAHDVGLHVDCCLGGFVVAFLADAGYPIPPFDFRVKGVTSISADTHKYACAPKGSSIVLYRTQELRRFQYFCAPNWPGGLYASPTIAGSRPGNLVVGCWTAMVYKGHDGYVQQAKELVQKVLRMKEAIKSHKELFVFGDPAISVVALGSKVMDAYRVGGLLVERGWDIGWIQFPNGVHISVTALTDAEAFVVDLEAVMEQIRREPFAPPTGAAKTYGAATSIPDRNLIDRLARGAIDLMYKPL